MIHVITPPGWSVKDYYNSTVYKRQSMWRNEWNATFVTEWAACLQWCWAPRPVNQEHAPLAELLWQMLWPMRQIRFTTYQFYYLMEMTQPLCQPHSDSSHLQNAIYKMGFSGWNRCLVLISCWLLYLKGVNLIVVMVFSGYKYFSLFQFPFRYLNKKFLLYLLDLFLISTEKNWIFLNFNHMHKIDGTFLKTRQKFLYNRKNLDRAV